MQQPLVHNVQALALYARVAPRHTAASMARSCSALRQALLQPLPADGIQGRRPTSTGRREVASSHSRVADGPAPNTRERNAGRLQQSLERFQDLVSEGVKPPDGLCNEVLQGRSRAPRPARRPPPPAAARLTASRRPPSAGLCAKHRLADARRTYDTAAALGCALRYSTYHQLSLAAAQVRSVAWRQMPLGPGRTFGRPASLEALQAAPPPSCCRPATRSGRWPCCGPCRPRGCGPTR